MSHASQAALLGLLVSATAAAQGSFTNFESARVHPLRVSADGTRLYAVNTPDNRLSVYSLANPSAPVLIRDIAVGLEPVSVTPRTTDEVWVVNALSDSVSVVSVAAGREIDVLRVVDEPADVAFAGGRAFVTAMATDEVHVFDASTRAPLAEIPLLGKDPKALAVSPDGTKVYALVYRSGNGSTVIDEEDAPNPPPAGAGLPAAPDQALIVDADDPAWQSQIPFDVPDYDIFEIDAATMAVTRQIAGVGTINFDLAVHPTTGDLYVANTDARNLIAFEPVLASHAVLNRLTRVTTGVTPTVTHYSLDAGIDFGFLPNPAAKAIALAEPTGVAIDAAGGLVYVAAHGTDRVAVLDTGGALLQRIEIGETPGSTVDTLAKRGPRGLALHPAQPRLYVLNALAQSISVVDTLGFAELSELALSHDPTPAVVKDGRGFLYDAKISGNGTMSCAACHVDGDLDGIAWDLGDPNGVMLPAPSGQPFPFNLFLVPFHPMKGPMTTQSLRGMQGLAPFHWRGDRPNLTSFQAGFEGILGTSQLPPADMQRFVDFLNTTRFPPNPNQNLDRTHTPVGAQGKTFFQQNVSIVVSGFPLPISLSCATCHTLPSGSNGLVITNLIIDEAQQMKVPHMRNLYRKNGMLLGAGQARTGFGFIHSGEIANITEFLSQSVFDPWPAANKPALTVFAQEFDTGTAPAVGYQVRVDASTAGLAQTTSNVTLLQNQALAGNCDLVVKGELQGELHGFVYDAPSGLYFGDDPSLGTFNFAGLKSLAQSGQANLVFTGVPPGSGDRIGIDRDEDGTLDGVEGLAVIGSPTAGCAGAAELSGNSEPKAGNLGFALVAENAPVGAPGFLGISGGQSALSLLGVALYLDLASPVLQVQLMAVDGLGYGIKPLGIPDDPSVVGASFVAQTLFLDACGSQGFSATNAIQIVVQP